MKFNMSKCYAIQITHKKNKNGASYNLGGSTLEKILNHTYFGVELNNKLGHSHPESYFKSKSDPWSVAQKSVQLFIKSESKSL